MFLRSINPDIVLLQEVRITTHVPASLRLSIPE